MAFLVRAWGNFDLFQSEQWHILLTLLQHRSEPKLSCKLFKNSHLILPSTHGNHSCTGILDIETAHWTKLTYDERTAPVGGTLDFWHGKAQKEMIFFHGFPFGSEERDEAIWRFYDLEHGWKRVEGVQLPKNVLENATRVITVHPDFC